MAWQTPKTDWTTNPKNPKSEDFNRIEGNIDFLKTDIETKKGLIVDAISDMNQPALVTDTHAELANKIRSISSDANAATGDVEKGKTFYSGGTKKTGTLELTGDAATGDVLSGKTFYNNDLKAQRTGAMPNKGAVTITPGQTEQTIPAGYHNGSGKVPAVVFDASKVLTGTTIAGKTGTMPNRGKAIITPGTTNKPIVQGYHDGTGYVATDVNLKPENIKDGVSIFGVTGSFKMLIILAAGDDIVLYTRPYVDVYNEYDGSDFVKKLEVKIHKSGSIRIRFSLRGAKSVFDGSYKGPGYAQIYKNGAPVGTLRTVKSDIYTTFTEDFAVAKNDLIQLYLRTTTSYTYVRAEDFQIKIVSPVDLGYVVEQTL